MATSERIILPCSDIPKPKSIRFGSQKKINMVWIPIFDGQTPILVAPSSSGISRDRGRQGPGQPRDSLGDFGWKTAGRSFNLGWCWNQEFRCYPWQICGFPLKKSWGFHNEKWGPTYFLTYLLTYYYTYLAYYLPPTHQPPTYEPTNPPTHSPLQPPQHGSGMLRP